MSRNAPALTKRRTRCLIIHRDGDTRRRLAAGLAKSGCATFPAQGRVDGLPLMFAVQPEIILLEVEVDGEEGWETYLHIRAVTDTPIVLLADKTLPVLREIENKENTLVLAQPISVRKCVAQTKALWKRSAARQAITVGPTQGEPICLHLRRLRAHEVKAIDHALCEVGALGEVHLVMRNGRLRTLVKFTAGALEREEPLCHPSAPNS